MPKPSLALRLHADPALAELVRLVGYRGRAYPISPEETQRLSDKYGKAKMAEAADELIDYDTSEKIAKLKPGVRRLCRQLLGPTPEEWDDFYEGMPNPPPNPYKVNQGPAAIAADPEERELLATMHGRRLRVLLLNEHKHFANHPLGDPVHAEAVRRMDLIEPIMKARGQKVPPRPADPDRGPQKCADRIQNLDGAELMQRYFTAKRVLEEESEHTGAFRQTKIEYDLLKAECHRRKINLPPTGFDDPAFEFTRHTTHRLHELLDMSKYELTKYDPESVTYKEAERDIGFIEAELERRSQEHSLLTGKAVTRGR